MNAPRGFIDTLAPARQRAQWRRDEALAQLTAARAHASAVRAEVAALDAMASEQSALASDAWRNRLDPRLQAQTLAFLASLHARSARASAQLAQADEAVKGAQKECALCETRLEALVRHRADAIKAFAQTQLRKETARADEDWLMRGHACKQDAIHE